MNVELVRPRLLSVGDFHRMIEAGILGREERVELVEGELIAMAAIGTRHASTVTRLTQVFFLKRPAKPRFGSKIPFSFLIPPSFIPT